MKLKRTIHEAHDLTRQLHEALKTQDQDLCDNLLERRAQAMTEFDRTHQDASSRDKKQCRDEIKALAEANRNLQECSREMLAQVSGEFRGQLGQSAQGKHSPCDETTQACLDRKV